MKSKFGQLYDMYYDCVYRYIFVSVRNKLNAEDITATVFTKIYENKDKITEVAASKNWIFSIAQSTIMDFYKTSEKIIPSENFIDVRTQHIAYENINIRDDFYGVKKNIDQLPEYTKKMVYLRFYGGLKFREIAETVDVKESTVKSVIIRAITKMAQTNKHSVPYDVI